VGGNGGISHTTLLVGLLGVCATVILGIGSWLLIGLLDVRERVLAIESSRPGYEHRLIAVEERLDALCCQHGLGPWPQNGPTR
jgi:hypothetical protein